MIEFIEFGSGIAGLAILIERRNAVDYNLESVTAQRPPSVVDWKEGDDIVIPGVGKGKILVPGSHMTEVKIGDKIPFKFPTRGLQRPPAKKASQAGPRRPRKSRFVFN